jgi:hypothetical protein
MSEKPKYAVYFHENALEVLGEAIKPYLAQGANGAHLLCTDIDTGGSLGELEVVGTNAEGKPFKCEIMVPVGMIRLVLSVGEDTDTFGFGVD